VGLPVLMHLGERVSARVGGGSPPSLGLNIEKLLDIQADNA